jgi:hypothetical protein
VDKVALVDLSSFLVLERRCCLGQKFLRWLES